MTEHGIISIVSISRERERQKEPEFRFEQTDTQTYNKDLLGSLQEPKIIFRFLELMTAR